MIAVAGDDHISKSSTAAHQSDHIFKACGLPVFFPANVQEILDLGMHAFAMSRFAGIWSGMKTIQEIVESSATAMIDPERVEIVHARRTSRCRPAACTSAGPTHALEQEARLMRLQVVRRARLHPREPAQPQRDRGPNDRFGIIASGKAYNDTRQALHRPRSRRRDLPPDRHAAAQGRRGVAAGSDDHARVREGLDEILVVEEKRQVIEYQLKEELYDWRPDVRPHVVGKFDESEMTAAAASGPAATRASTGCCAPRPI